MLLVGVLALTVLAPATFGAAVPAQQATETATPTATGEATAPPPPSPGPLSVTSVQPNVATGFAPVELVVTGTGFDDGATVVINNFGALETTFVSRNLLRALLSEGIAPGVYSVTVVNPNAATATLANALTITAPAEGTRTPEPTGTPAPTAYVRPLLVVQSYGASSAEITPGSNLDFEMTFANAGQIAATNVTATFGGTDFAARATGGVRAIGTVEPGQTYRFWQPLAASPDISGKTVAVLEVTADYTDVNGTTFSETFMLTFPVRRAATGPGATSTPTPTPTSTATVVRLRPQLLITDYRTDVDQLQPGTIFTLEMDIENLGNAEARRVTMIVGGGSTTGGSTDGTPQPGGGLSGASGEFSDFAPIGASNVSFLGDLDAGDSLQGSQRLIVNATTEAGAYPLQVSFVYSDENGASYTDDQVITLLVYSQPLVDINFYTEPPPLFAGQPGSLPLQLINIGNDTAVFGNFSVTAENAEFTNNTIFVGALDPGGFFPLDAQITPFQPGPLELIASVGYTDDFNQPQTITRTLSVEVMEEMIIEPPIEGGEGFPGEGFPPDGGGFPGPVDGGVNGGGEETLLQRIWRFISGLLGLGSGIQQPEEQVPVFPGEEFPIPEGPVGPIG